MSPAVKSALGHIEMCAELIAKYRKRIEGDQVPDVPTLERWIQETEKRKADLQRDLERIRREETVAPPLA